MNKVIDIHKVNFWTRTVTVDSIYCGVIECTKEERPSYVATSADGTVIGTYKTWKAATAALVA